jgi:hypothetical protein
VLDRINLGRPASISECGSGRQKVRSDEEVASNDGIAGRETRKDSAAGGGGGGGENGKNGSAREEL